jgi:hypothetical protein
MVLKIISSIVFVIFMISIAALDSDTTIFYYTSLGCLAYFGLLGMANNWGYKEDNDEQN